MFLRSRILRCSDLWQETRRRALRALDFNRLSRLSPGWPRAVFEEDLQDEDPQVGLRHVLSTWPKEGDPAERTSTYSVRVVDHSDEADSEDGSVGPGSGWRVIRSGHQPLEQRSRLLVPNRALYE